MTIKQLFIIVLVSAVVAVAAAFVVGGIGETKPLLGSVAVTNEYTATTTSAWLTHPTSQGWLIKTGQGTLGQIFIAKAGTAGGTIDFYNATTSIATKRLAKNATTTLLIASIPTDLAAGTYVLDAQFTDGLYVDVKGTIATTTILYR